MRADLAADRSEQGGRATRTVSSQTRTLLLPSPNTRDLRPLEVLGLQRLVGNRATIAALTATAPAMRPAARVAPKLAVGASDDPLERDADRIADLVMSTTGPPRTSQFREPRCDADFGGIRLHRDDRAAAPSGSIGAAAFTHGADVDLGAGHTDLVSTAGRRLLAHELAHTAQGGAATSGDRTVRRRVDPDIVEKHRQTLKLEDVAIKIVEVPDEIANLKQLLNQRFGTNKTKLGTPFKYYPHDNLLGVEDREASLASLLGLADKEKQPAYKFLMDEFQGGGYDPGAKLIAVTSADSRTLLHEMGHYVQDKAGFDERNAYVMILEYHNVLLHENLHEGELRTHYGSPARGTQSKSWSELVADAGDLPAAVKMLSEIDEALKAPKYAHVAAAVKNNLVAEYFEDIKGDRKAKKLALSAVH